jgi:hypothetical protein
MTFFPCQRLGDFLDQGLSDEERALFIAHLVECRTCHQAVEAQEHLYQSLRQAVVRLEPTPPGLAERIRLRIQRGAYRRFLRRTAGLVAASVLLGLGLWRVASPPAPERPGIPAEVEAVPPPGTFHPPSRPLVEVAFRPPSRVIAVPQPTDSPHVTLFWVYPAAGTAEVARVQEGRKP